MDRAILHPEQGERDARLLPFLMQQAPVGDRSVSRRDRRRPRKQPRFQRGVIEIVGQRPGQARRRRPLQVRADRPEAHRTRLRDGAVRQTGVVFQPEEFAKSSHQ